MVKTCLARRLRRSRSVRSRRRFENRFNFGLTPQRARPSSPIFPLCRFARGLRNWGVRFSFAASPRGSRRCIFSQKRDGRQKGRSRFTRGPYGERLLSRCCSCWLCFFTGASRRASVPSEVRRCSAGIAWPKRECPTRKTDISSRLVLPVPGSGRAPGDG